MRKVTRPLGWKRDTVFPRTLQPRTSPTSRHSACRALRGAARSRYFARRARRERVPGRATRRFARPATPSACRRAGARRRTRGRTRSLPPACARRQGGRPRCVRGARRAPPPPRPPTTPCALTRAAWGPACGPGPLRYTARGCRGDTRVRVRACVRAGGRACVQVGVRGGASTPARPAARPPARPPARKAHTLFFLRFR